MLPVGASSAGLALRVTRCGAPDLPSEGRGDRLGGRAHPASLRLARWPSTGHGEVLVVDHTVAPSPTQGDTHDTASRTRPRASCATAARQTRSPGGPILAGRSRSRRHRSALEVAAPPSGCSTPRPWRGNTGRRSGRAAIRTTRCKPSRTTREALGRRFTTSSRPCERLICSARSRTTSSICRGTDTRPEQACLPPGGCGRQGQRQSKCSRCRLRAATPAWRRSRVRASTIRVGPQRKTDSSRGSTPTVRRTRAAER